MTVMKSYVWQLNNLEAMEKYLMEYIITSPQVNILGYYHLPIEYMMTDLNLDRKTVEVALQGLISKDMVAYDQNKSVVAVKNFHFYDEVTAQKLMEFCDSLRYLPMSGVIKHSVEWVEKFDKCKHTDVTSRMKKQPWVEEALSMEEKAFVLTQEKAPVVAKEVIQTEAVEEAPAEEETANEEVADDEVETTEEVPSAEENHEEDAIPEERTNETIASEVFTAESEPAEETPKEAATEVNNEETITEEPKEEQPAEQEEIDEPKEAVAEEPAPKKKAKEPDAVKKQHIEEFEALWKKYPRKSNKSRALDGYLSMIKNGELTFSVASRALDNYLYQCKKDKTETQYIIGGYNFFGKNTKRILEFVEEEEQTSVEESDKELKVKLMPKFNMFWIIYPKKAGKEIAENNFMELVKSGDFDAEQLIEAANNYTSECRSKNTEEKYIKRADKFLDPTTRPFRDYIGRDDLNAFMVNVHSGEVEKQETNGIEAMDAMLAEEKAKEEQASVNNETATKETTEKAEGVSTQESTTTAQDDEFDAAMAESDGRDFVGAFVPEQDDDDEDALMNPDEDDSFGAFEQGIPDDDAMLASEPTDSAWASWADQVAEEADMW